MVQFCNPDRDINIVVAGGSVNTMASIGTMYRMGSTKKVTVTFTGTGEINCMSVNCGLDNVVVNGPTFVCQSEFSSVGKFTLNRGYIDAMYFSIGPEAVLNGGGVLVHGVEAGPYTTNAIRIDTKNQAVGQALANKFTDQYGQPLRFEVTHYDFGDVAYIYDSKGTYAYYAKYGATPEPTVGNFKDVGQSAYYAAPVAWAVEKDITTGTTPTTFSPEDLCTRAQIITFLWRAAGNPEPKSASPFSDVKADTYYAKATAWAAENGMASGSTFSPEISCTREMAVEFMWKLDGGPSAPAASFTDVSSQAVNWAVAKGVTYGTSLTTFSPGDTCTRAQIVTFLYRGFAQ